MKRRMARHTVRARISQPAELSMFKKVLVGVDGRDGGRDALALAQDLGGPRARYVLANVVSGSISGRAGAFWLTASRRYAQTLLEEERHHVQIATSAVVACDPSPGRALHDLALSEHADLIVVGAGRRRNLPRVLLGDDVLGTLDRSPCAVAVAPSGYRQHPDGWTTIGVGDDGSVLGDRALEVARELSHVHHTAVRALSIVGPESLSYQELMVADWSPIADRMEERLQARLSVCPGVEAEVLRGDAEDLLVALSEEVDLLVVATRGQSRMQRMLNGSTAHRLATAARCPLLILSPTLSPGPVSRTRPFEDSRPLHAPTS
jgi:nucleotide-binding universal stress UspA family protein